MTQRFVFTQHVRDREHYHTIAHDGDDLCMRKDITSCGMMWRHAVWWKCNVVSEKLEASLFWQRWRQLGNIDMKWGIVWSGRGKIWEREKVCVCVCVCVTAWVPCNGFSALRLGFDPVPVHVRFVVDKVALGLFLLSHSSFPVTGTVQTLRTHWFSHYWRYINSVPDSALNNTV